MSFKRTISRYGATCFILVFAITATCAAVSPLDVKVSAEKGSIALLEALPITVTFQNVSDTPFDLWQIMFAEEHFGSVLIKGPRRSITELKRPSYEGVSPAPFRVTLLPGKTFTKSILVSGEIHLNEGSIFDAPGQYKLWVHYDDGSVAATSEPISFSVVRPPSSERRALELVRELQCPVCLYEPAVIDVCPERRDEALPALEEIVSIEESIIYANYARVALAGRHLMMAQLAGSWPDRYDLETELAAAESLLGAIKNENFTLASKVDELRKQFKAFKAAESAKE